MNASSGTYLTKSTPSASNWARCSAEIGPAVFTRNNPNRGPLAANACGSFKSLAKRGATGWERRRTGRPGLAELEQARRYAAATPNIRRTDIRDMTKIG